MPATMVPMLDPDSRAASAERDGRFADGVATSPNVATYRGRITRVIQVVVLERTEWRR